MDSDSDTSYPNIAPMHDILQDALDDLVSSRTSTAVKGEALVAIEHVLAETSDPRATGLPEYFNALQDTFQCNVSSRIIAWTSATAAQLDKCLNKGSTDHDKKSDVAILSAQLVQGMSIIQGVALVHKSSKQFLGRRYPLEVLLDLLLISRHLNTTSSCSPSTPTSPKAGEFSLPPTKSLENPLASVILDTLLCILVDSIQALRVFEDLNGVQVVVKILKRAGTPREVRMKCLEFLYFYLLDETSSLESPEDSTGIHLSVPPVTPVRTPSPSHRAQSSISASALTGYTTSPSSRSSSASSAFSVLSTSTTATSASLHDPQALDSGDNASKDARPRSTNVDNNRLKSVIPGLTPSQRNVTPPHGGAIALGRGQPRSLLMLKKEVDYVPLSPKKPQLSHLGRGPSGLRPKLTERSNLSSTLAPKLRTPADVLSSEDTESEVSERSTGAALRSPRNRIGTGPHSHSHSRGLSVSSISSISSVSSTGSSPSHNDASRQVMTPGRDKAKEREIRTPFETPKPSSKMHRRAQSLADFGSESPAHAALKGGLGPRSASSPTGGASAGKKRGARTMQEKKEILGTMLGNVDALVEGVKKAGVWGLN